MSHYYLKGHEPGPAYEFADDAVLPDKYVLWTPKPAKPQAAKPAEPETKES